MEEKSKKEQDVEKLVKRVQSYLTKKEAEEIIPKFRKNFLNQSHHIHKALLERFPENILTFGFTWKLTEEGWDYWEKIKQLISERYYSQLE